MFKRRKFESGMSREIEFHLEQATQDYIERGLSPEEARLRARRDFGGLDLAKEELRDTRPLRWLAEFLRDARYILRTWRRSPGFAVGLIAVLALGLGSTTALFSVLDRILFRPLPYPEPDRLVSFGEILSMGNTVLPREIMLDRVYFQLFQPAPQPFQAVTTILGNGESCDLTEERPERLRCARVEANFLDVLRVRVPLGRNFTTEEDRKSAPLTAIISHALWLRRFGASPGAVGKKLEIDGKQVRIIGVLPPEFESPLGEADLLMPEQIRPFDPSQRGTRFLTAIGRLKPGVTTQQASAAIAPLIAGGGTLLPKRMKAPITRVRSLRDMEVGDASRIAWLLLAAGAVFLLIVCVNSTGLLLARFAARTREFEMRAALGATRARLARLAFAESILYSIFAGGLAMALSWGLLRIFLRLAPSSIPKIEQASMDFRILAISGALALGCGAAIGLWPALSSVRPRNFAAGRVTMGMKPRTRFALITAQIALTVALLGVSGLLLHSLRRLVQVPLGFNPEQTLTMAVTLNSVRYPNPQSQAVLFDSVLDRVRSAPSTIAAGWSEASPLGTYMISGGFPVDGAAVARESGFFHLRHVTPGYFETFRIPVSRGRAFQETDRDGPPTAILSETAERILFPGQQSVGHTIRPLSTSCQVIGVVKDVRNTGLTKAAEGEVYLIQGRRADAARSGSIALRTTLNSTDATLLLQRALAGVDSQLPSEIKTLADQVAPLTARPRFLAALLTLFGSLSLLVAAAGLYAVASFLVTQRTRDIGIRMALGASPGVIARQIVREALIWITAGAALGYGLAQMAARGMAAELPNVRANDAWSWVSTLAALAIAILFALAAPMRRAARIDPAVALRAE